MFLCSLFMLHWPILLPMPLCTKDSIFKIIISLTPVQGSFLHNPKQASLLSWSIPPDRLDKFDVLFLFIPLHPSFFMCISVSLVI